MCALFGASAGAVHSQHLTIDTGVNLTAQASTNPDLAPRGQEQSDIWLVLSPYFNVGGGIGQKLRVSGSVDLGASARLSLREGASFTNSTAIRPQGGLNTTWEAIDNFFYVDVRALVTSQLDDPFQATTDQFSPVSTSTSYQFGVAPYIRGSLPGNFSYEVRSDNSWTNFTDSSLQYAATNSINIQRAPQPIGGVFSYVQSVVSSQLEGQPNLVSDVARISLRYALTSTLALGARIGAEKYNYTIVDRDWQRYYGAEIGWRPNDRTSLEGYWEDRVFGNSWQLAFNYRRPRSAFTFNSSRLLTSTPQQFATFPGLANLVSLLDAAFATRIPDPVARQRAVTQFLSQTQLPRELLTPVIVNSEGFQITENNYANFVIFGQRNSLAFNLFWTSTETVPGLAAALPVTSKTLQKGSEVVFTRQLSPTMSANATASWRNTVNQLDTQQETTQTQLLLSASWQLARRVNGTLGARYQWITSTVNNDAVEAAIYATLTYSFN